MRVHRFLIIIFSVVIVSSCTVSRKEDIVGKQLTLGTEKFVIVQNPRSIINNENESEDKKFALVTYFGSECCSACALKMMTVWDSIADELGRDNIHYCFIFSNNDNTPEIVFRCILSQYYFSFPVCIDNYNVFISDNPFLTQFETPLSLLLDENDMIINYGRLDLGKKDLRRFRKQVDGY